MNKWQYVFCAFFAYLGASMFLRVVCLEIYRHRHKLEATRERIAERRRREAAMVVGTATTVTLPEPEDPP